MANTTYTEFYIDPVSGDNLNSGSSAGSPILTVSGTWDATLRTITCSGAPDLSVVTVGRDFGKYFVGTPTDPNNGITRRISAVNNTTKVITFDSTAVSGGTAPADGSTVNCRIGGAWRGMSSTTAYPFGGYMQTTMTDSLGNQICLNFKNSATYLMSTTLTLNTAANWLIAGYATNVRDGGCAVFSTGSFAASAGFVITGNLQSFDSIGFTSEATTNSNPVVSIASGGQHVHFCRCYFTGGRGSGVNIASGAAGQVDFYGCEFYNNGKANISGNAGLLDNRGGQTLRQCIVHDNAGANTDGVRMLRGYSEVHDTIFDSNGAVGLNTLFAANAERLIVRHSEFYNNGSHGLALASTNSMTQIEDSNFFKNNGWGIFGSSGSSRRGHIRNCAFGAGTQANTSGKITDADLGPGIRVAMETDFPSDATPWADPANGDFRIVHASAKAASRSDWTQSQSGYAGIVSYRDRGAAQSQSTSGGVRMVNVRGGADQ